MFGIVFHVNYIEKKPLLFISKNGADLWTLGMESGPPLQPRVHWQDCVQFGQGCCGDAEAWEMVCKAVGRLQISTLFWVGPPGSP
jgi:hypothetical protein